ncbi:MAG TPA: hypothetical protein ENI33_03960 [Thermoplasmatales archaeon]|nr:hypothetical protein [Thermoplasmatales archaeon]
MIFVWQENMGSSSMPLLNIFPLPLYGYYHFFQDFNKIASRKKHTAHTARLSANNCMNIALSVAPSVNGLISIHLAAVIILSNRSTIPAIVNNITNKVLNFSHPLVVVFPHIFF